MSHTYFTELDDSSVPHVLRLIYPRLEGQLMLAKNVQLIEALQEIRIHEEDTSFLSPQCQFILGEKRLPPLYLSSSYLLPALFPLPFFLSSYFISPSLLSLPFSFSLSLSSPPLSSPLLPLPPPPTRD